jgi:peptidoglycan hydrolase-like protein with peptidoglycan-binding domain
MALTCPRFNTSSLLQRIEQGHGTLAVGASGREVHLIQFALIDLGFAMPRSTGNANHSPDGSYGNETRDVVKAFQRSATPALRDDGVVGQLTLRELDRRSGGFKHRVRLHFRSIALTNVPFQRSLSNTQAVYAQYAIDAQFASGESVLLSAADAAKFEQIDQECNWDLTSGEFNEIQNIGSPTSAQDVRVFHVSRFADANVLGCGGHAANLHICTVTASALAWDTAHEIGHVLLGSGFSPVHVNDRQNLMHPSSRTLNSIPVLNLAQVTQMRTNRCCRAV